ncbi:MAG: AGE family epimerase/isomerase [Pseudomonadota bacterium]
MRRSSDASQASIERFVSWVQTKALPFWAETGLCPDGGVVERLDLNGYPERPGFKRVRVHARQAYVFSHAHVMGLPGMYAPAQQAISFLLAHGRDDQGGWVVKMGERGGIVDPDLDLYDQAFVILALVWWAKASHDPRAIATARETLAMIKNRFARHDGKGFLSRCPDNGFALQNPHMHLLEALLALHAVDPDGPARAVCAQLLTLFRNTLFDAQSGTIGETFDLNWAPVGGAAGQIIEPGHHFEWYWLLYMAGQAGFETGAEQAAQLFNFAERHGVRADTGLIHDTLDRTGAVSSHAHRSWPQTERIKASVAHDARTGTDSRARIAMAIDTLHRFYLDPAPVPGTWLDHVDSTGTPIVQSVPASTLYHLFLAHAELVRAMTPLSEKA